MTKVLGELTLLMATPGLLIIYTNRNSKNYEPNNRLCLRAANGSVAFKQCNAELSMIIVFFSELTMLSSCCDVGSIQDKKLLDSQKLKNFYLKADFCFNLF